MGFIVNYRTVDGPQDFGNGRPTSTPVHLGRTTHVTGENTSVNTQHSTAKDKTKQKSLVEAGFILLLKGKFQKHDSMYLDLNIIDFWITKIGYASVGIDTTPIERSTVTTTSELVN